MVKNTILSNKQPGFTLVELIVIVVIAILASISIVAYNGITELRRNNDGFVQRHKNVPPESVFGPVGTRAVSPSIYFSSERQDCLVPNEDIMRVPKRGKKEITNLTKMPVSYTMI